MASGYTREQRRALAEAVRRGETPRCPVCGSALARREVEPQQAVSYVRRRVWLICTGCQRSAALDLRADARP